MRKSNSKLLFSPSDLTTYLESPFSSWMDRCSLEYPNKFKRDETDESMELIQDKGNAHEQTVLQNLKQKFGTVYTVSTKGDFTDRNQDTLKAMASGAEVIYQAALCKASFAGYADFLIKVDGKSNLGNYHYEAWDSKLARSTKPYFVIQLLCYSEMLETIQGVFPKNISVILGNHKIQTLKTSDFSAYYESIKQRFLTFQNDFKLETSPFPNQGEEIRNWSTEAEKIILETDHLSQVANIRSVQIDKLNNSGIKTLKDLAQTKLESIPKMEAQTFQKLKKQAQLQYQSRGLEKPVYELIPHLPEDPKGLLNLPQFCEGDIYFDMEGYPLYDDQGLEYLFGLIIHEGNSSKFIDFWAHNHAQEKKAFEDFVDYVYARFKKFPSLHIYHYAAYEVTAIRRLSTQHATREFEVDQLLRSNVFVDLYRIVTQSLIVGEPSYSIKYIEHLYRAKRSGDVQNAAASLVEYARYLDSPDGETWQDSKTLKSIRDYNEVDCISTLELTLWLRDLQKRSNIQPVEPCNKNPTDVTNETQTAPNESEKLMLDILSKIPADDQLSENDRVRKLLAELLQFHRREKKQYFWKYFDWIKTTHFELENDAECIGNIQKTGTPTPIKSSLECEYSFNPDQEVKFSSGSKCQVYIDENSILNGEISSLNRETGKLTLKISKKALQKINDEFPDYAALLPGPPIDTTHIESSLFETVNNIKDDLDLNGLQPALADFLFRKPPKVNDLETLTKYELNDVLNLNQSTLCIQGPPGAGKTHAGKKLILELLKRGKKIAICSNSHQAIDNLLFATKKEMQTEKADFKIYKSVSDNFDHYTNKGIEVMDSKQIHSVPASANGALLIGATAWGLSREAVNDYFDYLFIDEAGQVSLANMIAIARCSKNIILLGDQMQLEQPIQGSHPGESGSSCLEYLLKNHATIPENLGVFLGTTYRMRESVCKFISDSFYESRLKSADITNETSIIQSATKGMIQQSEGLLFIPETRGHSVQTSPEEVETICKIINELKSFKIQEKQGIRPLIDSDILVVSPYNMQVHLLKEAVGPNIQVGTVDKFQGAEAAVVIVSMATSNLDLAPRGAEFLFNPNRINVAISRAKCLAIVVANPALQVTDATSVEKMKLINLFCKICLKVSQLE